MNRQKATEEAVKARALNTGFRFSGEAQRRRGTHGRQEVKFWEPAALQEYKTITDEQRRAQRQDATVSPQESWGFHRQEGPQLLLCSEALTCKGRGGGIAPDRADVVSYPILRGGECGGVLF